MTKNQKKKKIAKTIESKENEMINLAMNAAEKQLRDGTASSQVITHFLKLASTSHKMEQAKKEEEIQLLQAKTKNIKSLEDSSKLYKEALDAMKIYGGNIDE